MPKTGKTHACDKCGKQLHKYERHECGGQRKQTPGFKARKTAEMLDNALQENKSPPAPRKEKNTVQAPVLATGDIDQELVAIQQILIQFNNLGEAAKTYLLGRIMEAPQ